MLTLDASATFDLWGGLRSPAPRGGTNEIGGSWTPRPLHDLDEVVEGSGEPDQGSWSLVNLTVASELPTVS